MGNFDLRDSSNRVDQMAKKKKPPFTQLFSSFSEEQVLADLESLIDLENDQDSEGLVTILTACCKDPNRLFPTKISATSLQEYLGKWVNTYRKAYSNRPSQRVSKKPGTVPDEIINLIIETRLNTVVDGSKVADIDKDKVTAIILGHRLAMSAENIAGEILEEYLAERLEAHGWYCAWGSTMRDIDFCSRTGDLLQVKNRDNTENNASGSIRDGTAIEKWARGNAKTGELNWEDLKTTTGCEQLSEADFGNFVRNLIRNNPRALFVEEEFQRLYQAD